MTKEMRNGKEGETGGCIGAPVRCCGGKKVFVPFFDIIVPKKILTFRRLAYIMLKIFIIRMR